MRDRTDVRECVWNPQRLVDIAWECIVARQARKLCREKRDGKLLRPVGKVGIGLPAEHASLVIDRRLVVVQRRRPLGVPAVLVVPHPLHAHGPAHRARENERIDDDVIGAILAEATRCFGIVDADALIGQAEKLSAGVAQTIRGLGGGPDRGTVRTKHPPPRRTDQSNRDGDRG